MCWHGQWRWDGLRVPLLGKAELVATLILCPRRPYLFLASCNLVTFEIHLWTLKNLDFIGRHEASGQSSKIRKYLSFNFYTYSFLRVVCFFLFLFWKHVSLIEAVLISRKVLCYTNFKPLPGLKGFDLSN